MSLRGFSNNFNAITKTWFEEILYVHHKQELYVT